MDTGLSIQDLDSESVTLENTDSLLPPISIPDHQEQIQNPEQQEQRQVLQIQNPEQILQNPNNLQYSVKTRKNKKSQSGHAIAGKKAESSEKGRAWLNEIKEAKQRLNMSLRNIGIATGGQQKDARRLASLQRSNPTKAKQYIQHVLSKHRRMTRKNNQRRS
jgi:hypothetical protein